MVGIAEHYHSHHDLKGIGNQQLVISAKAAQEHPTGQPKGLHRKLSRER